MLITKQIMPNTKGTKQKYKIFQNIECAPTDGILSALFTFFGLIHLDMF